MLPYQTQLLPIEKVFRDPVHHYIHVQHQVIWDLINSAEMQRLRRIKQLGTTSFTFHGAEHSRFSHSLGVYEITRRICDIFQNNYPNARLGSAGWQDEARLVALCAALLHDVGHGPYSHTFEHIFQTDHEALTTQIITSEETEVFQILQRVAPDFPQKVASVITKTYPNPQVVQMISSQIDADRMDYLLRDAYFTGAKYGTFDLTRILRVIRPYEKGIAFSMSGMHAVEDYIVSRYQMYAQVYFHPVSRGMEVILDHLLQRAKEYFLCAPRRVQQNASALMPFFTQTYTLQDYLKLDDGVLTTYFGQWLQESDPILSDLAQRFLFRKPFKSITFDRNTQEQALTSLRQLISEVGYDPLYYTATNASFDAPYDLYQPSHAKQRTQIALIEKDDSLIELSQASHLVAALAKETLRDDRFYFPREMIASDPQAIDLFEEVYRTFRAHIHNGAFAP